jgi:hypothetical protein
VDESRLGRRAPPAAWEAYLLIGVFPEGSAHAWTKAHVFVGRARAGWHCLSAVEALDGPGEAVMLSANATHVQKHAWSVDETSCERARGSWHVKAPGLQWDGFPASVLSVSEPAAIEARVEAGTGAWWARLPRVLSYFTAFGRLTWSDAAGESRGVALLERAWGADVPVDVAKLAPRRWQWDVLVGDDGAVHAGLCVGGVGLRTMARGREDDAVATGRPMRVRVKSWRQEPGRRVPEAWEGEMRTSAGTLRYEARASTPVAAMVPGGGFVGMTWEGKWEGRRVQGTGFSEYSARGS